MRADSFERFYYEKVALGEGCGCAEQVINLRDAEERARHGAVSGSVVASAFRLLRRLARVIVLRR